MIMNITNNNNSKKKIIKKEESNYVTILHAREIKKNGRDWRYNLPQDGDKIDKGEKVTNTIQLKGLHMGEM